MRASTALQSSSTVQGTKVEFTLVEASTEDEAAEVRSRPQGRRSSNFQRNSVQARQRVQMDWAAWRSECTWQKLWKERSLGQICEHFAKVLLLTLIPSVFDLVTDVLSARNFIYGTDYMKQTVNLSLSHAENCTSIGYYITSSKVTERL